MEFDKLINKKEIVFHTANLRDEDLGVLAKVVQKTQVLETLNLSCNNLTLADGRFTFALALNSTIKVLYLSQNKIGPDGANQLSMALKANDTLVKLGMDGNDLGDAGAKVMSTTLIANKTLESLSLGANQITDAGAKAIATPLKDQNNCLGVITLRGNKISSGGAQHFLDALATNVALYEINLGVDQSSRAVRAKIDEILKDPKRRIPQLEMSLSKKDKEIAKVAAQKDAVIAKKDEEISSLKVSMAMYISTFDGQKVKELADQLATLQTYTSIYVNSFEKPKESALARKEDELASMRTQMSMYINSFEKPKESALARKEDELASMQTQMNMYINSFEKPKESALARKEDELVSLRTFTDMYVNSFEDPKKKDNDIAKKDDDIKLMTLYTNMMMGLTLASEYKAKMLIAPSKADVGSVLCSPIVSSCKSAMASRGAFSIALSGGSLPAFLQALPDAFSKAGVDPQWDKWHVLLADERCVVVTDAESNLGAIQKNFTSKVPIPESQVYGIDESLLNKSTAAVAAHYEKNIVVPLLEKCGGKLDCTVLGFGPDGHTCSLFPGHALLEEKSCLVAPIEDSPKPPPCRITLTFPVLNEMSRQIIFCGAGAGKAPILKAVFGDAVELSNDDIGTKVDGAKAVELVMNDPAPYPCGMVRTNKGGESLIWVADTDATKEGIVIS